MINDIFGKIAADIGSSLFADDGALWKIERNIKYATGEVQGIVDEVVKWGYDRGCRFSVEKTQRVCFTGKRIEEGKKLTMYGKELERVGSFTFLGVIFD